MRGEGSAGEGADPQENAAAPAAQGGDRSPPWKPRVGGEGTCGAGAGRWGSAAALGPLPAAAAGFRGPPSARTGGGVPPARPPTLCLRKAQPGTGRSQPAPLLHSTPIKLYLKCHLNYEIVAENCA